MRLYIVVAYSLGNDVNRVAGTIVLVFLIGITLFTGAVFWRLSAPEQPQRVEVPATIPQQCAHLYNVGRHEEWCECIGVGYVSD